MNYPTSKMIFCGLLFLFTAISGIWLSHTGKPLNGVIFTIHKLIALSTVIVIGINVTQLYSSLDIRSLLRLLVIAVTGLLFLALIVSGALLSLAKPAPEAILRIHQVVTLLALSASAVTVSLLIRAGS